MSVKIAQTGYPIELQVEERLRFKAAESAQTSLILQRRVAAWLRDLGFKSYESFGHRSDAKQAQLYVAWIAYRNYKADPKKYPKAPPANPAAPPGSSWHGDARAAIDLSGTDVRAYVEAKILPHSRLNQPCNKYGICFTMNHVDAPGQEEWWHVVLIETCKYTGNRSEFLAETEAVYGKPPTINTRLAFNSAYGIWISEFVRLTNIGFTDKDVKLWQKANGLTPDGVIGPKSWKVAYKNRGIMLLE